MSAFSVGDAHCLDCGAEVSVEHVLHSFINMENGLVYKGTALDGQCQGKPEDGAPIERVRGVNRVKRWRPVVLQQGNQKVSVSRVSRVGRLDPTSGP